MFFHGVFLISRVVTYVAVIVAVVLLLLSAVDTRSCHDSVNVVDIKGLVAVREAETTDQRLWGSVFATIFCQCDKS